MRSTVALTRLPGPRVPKVPRRATAQRGRIGTHLKPGMDSVSHPPLCDDETLRRRHAQVTFVARGMRSSEAARRIGSDRPAETVHAELQRRLDARRKAVLG